MLNDMITSIIRTTVPTIVGAAVGYLTVKGINIDESAVAGLATFLTAVFSGLYYIVARFLETRYPQAGWLLGSAKKPEYTESK